MMTTITIRYKRNQYVVKLHDNTQHQHIEVILKLRAAKQAQLPPPRWCTTCVLAMAWATLPKGQWPRAVAIMFWKFVHYALLQCLIVDTSELLQTAVYAAGFGHSKQCCQ